MPLLSPWAGCLFFTSSLSRLLRRSCGPRGKRPSCFTFLWARGCLPRALAKPTPTRTEPEAETGLWLKL